MADSQYSLAYIARQANQGSEAKKDFDTQERQTAKEGGARSKAEVLKTIGRDPENESVWARHSSPS